MTSFRTLPSSHATGAKQIGRLTNLMNLTVDTSWWIRYRSRANPDFGATFPQLIEIVNRPSIPARDIPMGKQLQAIANTAAFHFGTIEQGGSSLYDSMALKVSDLTVLRIVTSIGGTEVFHFAIWNDGAGNVPAVKVPGLVFPDIATVFEGDPLREKDLIMPEPCRFIDAESASLLCDSAYLSGAGRSAVGRRRPDKLRFVQRSKPGVLQHPKRPGPGR